MVVFFLRLSLEANIVTESANFKDIQSPGFASFVAGLFVKCGILLGGLIAAQKMGIAAAGAGLKAAEGFGKGILGILPYG